MTALDPIIGETVLRAQANAAAASRGTLLMAWIFGAHCRVHYRGDIPRIGFWRGKAYLLSSRGA